MKALLITLDDLYLDNTLSKWLWALGTAALVLLLTLLIRRLVRGQYQRLAGTQQVELMEVPLQIGSKTTTIFLVLFSLFLASLTLKLPDAARTVMQKTLLIAVCWQVGIWATTGAVAWINLRRNVQDRASAGTLGIVTLITRVLIWSVVLLLTLDNLGVNITTLVAGFGIGGIAVALAVQNVLGDLLASLSITLDKPFLVGDALVVDDFNGTVEHIGLKSTRLRSISGEQIVMPNADLLKSRLRNFGRMQERRIVFALALVYETPRAKLQQVPILLRQVIEAQAGVRFERCYLVRLGPSAIEFEVSFFVLSERIKDNAEIQHDINLQVLELFQDEHLQFAYTTQRLLLERVPATDRDSVRRGRVNV